MSANKHGLTRRQVLGIAGAGVGALLLKDRTAYAVQSDTGWPKDWQLNISWFIKYQNYLADENFEPLLELLTRNRSVVDEVGLFEAPSNAWLPPLDFLAATGNIMRRRFEQLRRVGVSRTGICVINNLGINSDDAGRGGAPKIPFPMMVGIDGREAQFTGCPNRQEFHAYTKSKYALMAKTSPDYIWLSDDMRMQSHGKAAVWGCFCPVCLDLFSGEVRESFTREKLLQRFNEPGAGSIRKAWVEHNATTLNAVFATIGRSIREVEEKIQTGMMSLGVSYSSYSGSAYERWFAALGASKARPGQGFYYDTSVGEGLAGSRIELLTKAFEVSRQCELYSARVSDRQYEYESWPDGALVKEPGSAINELALSLAAGCNGAVFDTLGWGPPYDEYVPLLQGVSQARPYLQSILEYGKDAPPAGLWSAWSPDMMANREVHEGESWLPSQSFEPELPYDLNLPVVLAQVGVPLSSLRGKYGAVLAGRTAETLNDAELHSLLAGGLLLDVMALRVLAERGLGDLTGVSIGSPRPDMTMARMTADSMNGKFKGARHWTSVLQGFASNTSLSPLFPSVRILAELQDEVGEPQGPCTTAFVNSLGGRVVVNGFSPWWYLHWAGRRHQMLEIADWVSGGQLPIKIVEPLPLTPFIRMDSRGKRGVVVLFNTGLSEIEHATILIRSPRDTSVRLSSIEGVASLRRFVEGQSWGVIISRLPAWSTVSLLLG